jgi:hypothetical protein
VGFLEELILYRKIQVRVMAAGKVDMVSVGGIANQVSKPTGGPAATGEG